MSSLREFGLNEEDVRKHGTFVQKHRIDHIKSNVAFMDNNQAFNPFESKIWYNKPDLLVVRSDILEKNRSDNLFKISKWDKFRINRTVIVDGFIRARRAKLFAELII